jgi:hypothetical protein
MPVTVEWDNPEKTIMRMAMIGRWTWDEAYDAQLKGDTMINEVVHPVGAIVDLRQSTGIPLSAMANARGMTQKQNSRTKVTVFLGANPFFLSLWNVFRKVYGALNKNQQFGFASTLPEAHQFINDNLPKA